MSSRLEKDMVGTDSLNSCWLASPVRSNLPFNSVILSTLVSYPIVV